jgi:hypothetical protein
MASIEVYESKEEVLRVSASIGTSYKFVGPIRQNLDAIVAKLAQRLPVSLRVDFPAARRPRSYRGHYAVPVENSPPLARHCADRHL